MTDGSLRKGSERVGSTPCMAIRPLGHFGLRGEW
jgi:hypothetical protein